jgi:polyphosphate kinase 2 (PPK2 family)
MVVTRPPTDQPRPGSKIAAVIAMLGPGQERRLGSLHQPWELVAGPCDLRLDQLDRPDLQAALQRVQQAYLGTSHRAAMVLEGWDTAGKGGVVRRLGWALDPRSFKVHTIAAPGEHERSLHYLQRFWERLPQHGQIVAFDRSWYGRVLVERVEGFATEDEWCRASEEINEFERMLVADGVRLVKLFLHITRDEQLRRFHNRLTNPLKRWKLSYEDFRNRARWKDYETAIEDMMRKTSTRRAPWHLIPANDKPFGRLAALWVIADRLSKDVSLEPRPLDPKVVEAAERLLRIRLQATETNSGHRPAKSSDRE